MEACRNERNFIMNNTTPTVNVNVNQNNTQTINSSANTNINMKIKDIFKTNLSEEDFLRIKEIVESSMPEKEKQNGIKEFIKDVGASTISKLLTVIATNFWL